ncbi:bestrophin-like domain [Halomonas denitrificans]|nr:hypothetical protein [Halomonas denitrificans]
MTPWMELLIAILFVAVLLVAVDIGRWLAGRHLERGSEHTIDAGTIQGAMLGLLALLLGFSFGGASGRFVERQDLVVADRSAIEAVWLRADLLPPEASAALRDELVDYLAHRLGFSADQTIAGQSALPVAEQRLDRMWSIVVNARDIAPPLHVEVLDAVGALFDVLDRRVAASHRHLPMAILALLVICSLLSLLVIGYSGRLSGHRRTLLTRVLAVLIAAALLATVDMDHGRVGLIQVSDAPLDRLADRLVARQAGPSATG